MSKYLRFTIGIICLVLASQCLNAQMGIRVKYLSNGLDNEQENLLSDVYSEIPFKNTLAIGVDYWFRAKEKRIEFLPEIGFSYSKESLGNDIAKTDFSSNSIFLNFNTRIYPMDFGGDCDCPTFSNQSTLIKKGFYFELSPGIAFNNSSNEYNYTNSAGQPIAVDGTSFISYKVGIAVGLDIGISNLLTINPYAMYSYCFNVDHVSTNIPTEIIGDREYGTTQGQLELGLRFSFRFDAKKY